MRLKIAMCLFLFGMLALFNVGCGSELPQAPVETKKQALVGTLETGEPATMVVRAWSCGPGCRGSSTLISPNVVLTNKHVVNWTGASSFFLQQGPTPYVNANNSLVREALQVVEKVHHPDANVDLAVLRLGCRVTGVTPALLNRTALTSQHIGIQGKWIGYGPTTWTGTDHGIKRSNTSTISSFNAGTLWPLSIYTAPGDSGGSVYAALPETPIEDDPTGGGSTQKTASTSGGSIKTADAATAGGKTALYPVRKLIGVITWSSGGATRVDPYEPWIRSWINQWQDNNLQPQPQSPTINQLVAPRYPAAVEGIYQIANPQPGVTYTWSSNNSFISFYGTNVGNMVMVSASSLGNFTLTVTATTAAGCRTTSTSQSFSVVYQTNN